MKTVIRNMNIKRYTNIEEDNSESNFILIPNYINKPLFYLNELSDTTDWYSGEYTKVNVDRVQRYYSLNNKPFLHNIWKKHFDRWKSHDYPEWLHDLQNKIAREFHCNFTGALINKYKSGNDFIKAHQDTTETIDPLIASVSFGASRTFKIVHTISKVEQEIVLNSGDLLIMSGSSQRYYTHEILKDDSTGIRYNITFR